MGVTLADPAVAVGTVGHLVAGIVAAATAVPPAEEVVDIAVPQAGAAIAAAVAAVVTVDHRAVAEVVIVDHRAVAEVEFLAVEGAEAPAALRILPVEDRTVARK